MSITVTVYFFFNVSESLDSLDLFFFVLQTFFGVGGGTVKGSGCREMSI